MQKIIAYDLEIKMAIPSRNDPPIEGIEYCAGWDDHENMGIAVLCTAELFTHSQHVFFSRAHDVERFKDLCESADIIVGFNNHKFDDEVIFKSWSINMYEYDSDDLLRRLWQNAGLDPDVFNWETHCGFGLDATCKANGLPGKIGYGGTAPVDWQQGRHGSVITYCLDDALKTAILYERYLAGELICPKTGKKLSAIQR